MFIRGQEPLCIAKNYDNYVWTKKPDSHLLVTNSYPFSVCLPHSHQLLILFLTFEPSIGLLLSVTFLPFGAGIIFLILAHPVYKM